MATNLEFACPRCRRDVQDVFYGPCMLCRTELRAAQALDAKDVVLGDYVPKMNVTPNAVASKE